MSALIFARMAFSDPLLSSVENTAGGREGEEGESQAQRRKEGR